MDRAQIQMGEIGGYVDFTDSKAQRLAYERFDRAMLELDEKSKREVEALGFSSWEEKSRRDDEQLQIEREEYIRVHGPPPPHIPTREEEAASKIQIRKSLACAIDDGYATASDIQLLHQLEKEYQLAEWVPEDGGWCLEPERPRKPCTCKEHLHPRFCPEELVGYKSMGDDPSHFELLQCFNPTDLSKLQVEEDDPSNRVDERNLPVIWGLSSQSNVLRLPQWAKRDDVVQGIIDTQEVDRTVYHGEYDLARPMPMTISSATGSFVSLEPTSARLRNFERECAKYMAKRDRDAAKGNTDQALPTPTASIDKASTDVPTTDAIDGSPTLDPPAPGAVGQRAKRGRSGQPASKVQKIPTSLRSRASGVGKPQAGIGTRTRQAVLSDKRQTRSKGTYNLLALDKNGHATRLARS